MHLSKFGFQMVVIVWLVPIIVADFAANGIYTDWHSDMYFWKAIVDCALVAFAIYMAKTGEETASAASARSRQLDKHDDVVDFAQVGAFEYVYCAVLAVYAAGNFITLHAINKEAQGPLAWVTLIWSFVSLLVLVLSGVQFWRLKSGAIVELKKRVIQ